MNSSQPPRLASALLNWLDPSQIAVIGDIEESYRNGRSRFWYWRQALALMLLSPIRQVKVDPGRSIGAVALGWAIFLASFAFFDQFIAWRFTSIGYRTGVWPPFWIAAFVCSYLGFAVSAWTVAKAFRRDAGPILMLHVASVLVAMGVAVLIAELRSPNPTPVPHVLFPLVSVALPYQWRSGFVLAPLTMLIAGMVASRTDQQRGSR